MSKYLTVTDRQYGQPRPYADHEFIVDLCFTQDDGRLVDWLGERSLPLVIPQYVDEDTAHKLARVYCPYMETTDPNYNWASRHLVSFTPLDPTPVPDPTLSVPKDRSDRWRIHVRAAFTD